MATTLRLALHGLLLLLTKPAADIIPLLPTETSALLLLPPKLGLLLLLPTFKLLLLLVPLLLLLLLFSSDGLLLLLCMGLFGRLFVALLLLSLIPKALEEIGRREPGLVQ